ncbi:MAG TPA: LytTR family DNA-binding domain-containing protein [Pyrinomonadaceae bacterium]|jgi:two-component system LytT family response regulator
MKIRTLIADDVPPARKRIRRYLSDDPEIVVVGECADGGEAVAAVRDLAPDLIFLDVQMPELDGFQVIEALDAERPRAVIFVTAYDEYTLRAFEFHALDYLLKPFDRARLLRAVEHAKAQLGRCPGDGCAEARLRALLQELGAPPKYLKRLVVRSQGRATVLAAEEVDYIKAEGSYLRLKAGKESHLMRERLSRLEDMLDPRAFARIHRSVIVNIDRIRGMQPLFNGDQIITLRDSTQLTLSRSYRDTLLSRL